MNKKIRWIINLTIIFVILGWSVRGMDINLDRIRVGIPQIGVIIAAMIPPDIGYLETSLRGMLESIHIAVIGTTIAGILAFPISFTAASNIGLPKPLVVTSKQILNAIRTFPNLIKGIFFVAAYGPGALAGVMAIGVHSIGMLGKLNSEIVENIDRGSIEALEASGANNAEIFMFAIVPQVLPEFIGTTLYRFELNLRVATVLGLVGAGGIGVTLLQSLQFRRWAVVGMSLIVIVIVVMTIDYASAYIRKKII